MSPRNEIITIIGAGSGGITVLEALLKIGKLPSERVTLIQCDVDKDRLYVNFLEKKYEEKRNMMKAVFLENVFAYGLGTLANTEQGDVIFERNKDIIDSMIDKSDKIFLCCGLGGGLGNSFVVNFSTQNAGVYSYLLYPLKVESKKRKENARKALEKMKDTDYKLLDMDTIVMQNFEYLKENNLLTTKGIRTFSAELMAKVILKDIESYLKKIM